MKGGIKAKNRRCGTLPTPTEDWDAVKKAYLEQRLAELEALIGKVVT